MSAAGASPGLVGGWRHQLVREELTGWGRHPRAICDRLTGDSLRLGAFLEDPSAPLAIPRGAGRSYGDAALCSPGVVLQVPTTHRISIDPVAPRLRAPAGLSLGAATRAVLAARCFLPVLPGTGAVTLGGAVAGDIHGKNHHREGSFGDHLLGLQVRTANNELQRTVPGEPLFETTVGGHGLTGVIEEVELALLPVESAWIRIEERVTARLAETIETLQELESRCRYAVAWIDTLASGRTFGRGIVVGGDHATPDELPTERRDRPFETPDREPWPFPSGGDGLLCRLGVRGLNAARVFAARVRPGITVRPWRPFFFPLDGVQEWNRAYGVRGFRQHQSLLPPAHDVEGVESILHRLRDAGHPPTLTVLKGFGAGRGGLSFPRRGLTLAIDCPRRPGLDAVLREVDRGLADLGGRIYLAKDSGTDAELYAAMTPELPEFRRAVESLDPRGRFGSDLSIRIGLRAPG